MPDPRGVPLPGLRAVQLPALSVGSRISPLFDRPRHGSLIAAFPRSCYLDLDGRIVAVVAAELLNGPLNLVVSLPAGATFTGDPVGGGVEVHDRILEVVGGWSVDVARAQVWDARLASILPTETVRVRLAAVRAILEADAPPESLARAAQRPPRAAGGMELLARGLRSGDAAGLGTAARELAGLGPGLTPSGDDVLAGSLLAVAVMRPALAQTYGRSILSSVRGRTTRISEAYLEAAAGGEAGEAWHRLLAILRQERGESGPAELDAAVARILAFGETSGADMLAGFLLAMTALLP